MPEANHVTDPHDVSVRGVRWGALAIAGGIVFALVASWLAWRLLREPQPIPPRFHGTAPLLQPAPQPERAAYFAEKERVIDGYGWVDRQHGVARIPVEQAMRLMAAGRAAR